MRYRGRQVDPIALWGKYVDFPHNLRIDGDFLPKVQCPNPDHDTNKQHFQINVSQPTVHCFAGCGISGSYEHAICLIEGLYEKFKVEEATDDREKKRRRQRARNAAAKIILGHRMVGSVQHERRPRAADHGSTAIVRRVDDLAYETFLPQSARSILASRSVSSESIAQWELGWNSDELRIVIPAKDFEGRLKFLIRRATRPKDQPKYLYSEGVPKTSLLFGACMLDLALVRSFGLALVEGSIDTIINSQNGIPTGGILGTGISEAQCRVVAKVRPKKIFLMFDKDMAGVHNIEIASRKLRKYPMYVCRYPKGKLDPAELSREEAMRSIERAVPLMKWLSENFPNAKSDRRKVLSG